MSRSPDPHAAPLHSADRLSDPTGRRITLLVSDCAGPLWRSGHAHRLLHQLSRQAPVAVLQPLPQRMWNRTRLPVTYGELTRGETLGGATALRVRTPRGLSPEARRGAPRCRCCRPSRWHSAPGRGCCPGGRGSGRRGRGWVRADQPAAPAARPGRRPSALELVSRFRSTASPAAGRLAVYLAAAPLCLPVMQLVQRTMLPDSGPSELAEVLLSGLLSRAKEDYGGDGVQWYEFAPGVQESLLSPLGRDEAMLVLKHCSEYIEQRFGKGGPNFPALPSRNWATAARAAPTRPTPPTRRRTGTTAARPSFPSPSPRWPPVSWSASCRCRTIWPSTAGGAARAGPRSVRRTRLSSAPGHWSGSSTGRAWCRTSSTPCSC